MYNTFTFIDSMAAHVVWKRNYRDLNQHGRVVIRNNGTTLKIARAHMSDTGNYTCRVNGSTTTNTVELHVHSEYQ